MDHPARGIGGGASSLTVVVPTYVYETIPRRSGEPSERFEWRQSMRDAPLKVHPETGRAVRRVVTGGFGLMKVRARGMTVQPKPAAQTGCCPGCHD